MNTQAKVCIIFKKGHIVPRWCGALVSDRKARHCIVFGCDVAVTIVNGRAFLQHLTRGPLILISRAVRRPMKNGSYKRVHTNLSLITSLGVITYGSH